LDSGDNLTVPNAANYHSVTRGVTRSSVTGIVRHDKRDPAPATPRRLGVPLAMVPSTRAPKAPCTPHNVATQMQSKEHHTHLFVLHQLRAVVATYPVNVRRECRPKRACAGAALDRLDGSNRPIPAMLEAAGSSVTLLQQHIFIIGQACTWQSNPASAGVRWRAWRQGPEQRAHPRSGPRSWR